jgi:hypothetical protein
VSLGAQRFAVMQLSNSKNFAALHAFNPTGEYQWFVDWRR